MTGLRGWLGALSVTAAFVTFAEIRVGYHQVDGVDVPGGEERTLEEGVILRVGGTFGKTGDGTLTVPLTKLDSSVPGWEIRNHKGTMKLTPGAAEATFSSEPPSIIAEKAALWLNMDSVVTTNGENEAAYVTKWLDVRDAATPDAPQRAFATPDWGSLAPEASSNHPPVKTQWQGRDGLFFGGPRSGKFLKLSATLTGIRQNFIVHGVETCWGTVVGHSSARTGMLVDTYAGTVMTNDAARFCKHFSRRVELASAYSGGRFHKDGVAFDPYTVPPTMGFQLLECAFPVQPDSVNQIFRGNFETFAKTGTTIDIARTKPEEGGPQGGDYVSEIILFTNVLSETERLDVERYLMRKWALPQGDIRLPQAYLSVTGAVATAAGAVTELAAGEGEVLPLVELRGSGTYKKKGAGELHVGASKETSPGYTFLWEDGAIVSRGGRPPAVKANAGDAFDGSVYVPFPARNANRPVKCDVLGGAKLTRTATAGAGKVVKTGDDWVRVNEVAEGVRTINVREGVFALEAKTRVPDVYDADTGFKVAVTNADFELPFDIDAEAGRGTLNHNAQNGWSGGSSSYVALTNAGNAWFGTNPQPPSGAQVLRMNDTNQATVPIVLPAAGWYEFSVMAKNRYGSGSTSYKTCQGYCEVRVGKDTDHLKPFGRFMASGVGFARYSVRFYCEEAGAHVLQLYVKVPAYDGSFLLDDVEIHALGRTFDTSAVKVPNGDFEQIDYPTDRKWNSGEGAWTGTYDFRNKPTGWTLDISKSDYPNATNRNPPVGIASPAFLRQDSYVCHSLWDLMQGPTRLFFFGWKATATTAKFAVSAGHYRLRADVARHNFAMTPYNTDTDATKYAERTCEEPPQFTAVLTLADGSAVDLGGVKQDCFMPSSRYWDKEIVLAADQEVSLTIGQSSQFAAGWVDNLELVPAESFATNENLLKNPGAESDVASSNWTVSGDTSYFVHSQVGLRTYDRSSSNTTKNFGYAALEGKRYFYIQSAGTMRQTVTISAPGLYRFKCHTKTRGDGYCDNHVRLWCRKADSTSTNVIDTILVPYMPNFLERAYLIDFSEAGDYEIGLTGLGVLSAGTNADKESHFDSLSLSKVAGSVDSVPTMPDDVKITVAKGARLVLDFPGCKTVRLLKLGDTNVPAGVVKASDYPDYLGGIGELEVKPVGGVILVR